MLLSVRWDYYGMAVPTVVPIAKRIGTKVGTAFTNRFERILGAAASAPYAPRAAARGAPWSLSRTRIGAGTISSFFCVSWHPYTCPKCRRIVVQFDFGGKFFLSFSTGSFQNTSRFTHNADTSIFCSFECILLVHLVDCQISGFG